MAAILHPQPTPATRPHGGTGRPQLTLIHGGRSDAVRAATFRRRRLAAALVVLVLAVATFGAGRALVRAVTPHAPVAAATAVAGGPTVVVQPGDSLWSIARRVQPSGDVRSLVDQLAAQHGPGALQPGERIALPA